MDINQFEYEELSRLADGLVKVYLKQDRHAYHMTG